MTNSKNTEPNDVGVIFSFTRLTFSQSCIALLFLAAGIVHLVRPSFYTNIMPPYIPWALVVVYLTGLVEIVGSIALFIPALRRAAGMGFLLFLIAVLPVHIQMLMHPNQFQGIPFWIIVVRIPIQFVLMWWVYVSFLSQRPKNTKHLNGMH